MDLSALAKEMQGAIGENADDQAVSNWLDTGYAPLNKVIGGAYNRGLPYGRIVEMFGPPSSGKTALTQMWMVEAQRLGGVAIFMDHEKAFSVDLGKKLGLDDTFPRWIYQRPKTWEESNTRITKAAELIRAKKAIPEEAPIIAVLDSVAAAMPKSQAYDSKGKERGIDEYTMNDTTALARVSSTTLKAVNHMAAELNVTLVYLNQIRTAIGVVYGDPTTTPGGKAFEFFASVRLSLGRKRIMEEKDGEKTMTGQEIVVKATKNKVARPFQEASIRFMFQDDGSARFDPTMSMIEHLIEIGRLPTSGARVTWTDGKSYFKKQLAEMIDKAGAQAELTALLP